MRFYLDTVRQKYGEFGELDPVRRLILKEACERAKIDLSTANATSIDVPGFLSVEGRYLDLSVSLDQSTFEALSKPLLDRTIGLLKKALNSAKARAGELTALLLLGGSSRIPKIRDTIRRELGISPFTGVNPETCVAQGATIQAAVFEGATDLRGFLLLDVIPSSYGVETKGGMFTKMIERNTTVPRERKEVFTTTEDSQATISVGIYQGEGEFVRDNTFLGTLELSGIPPSPKGIPQIEVTFAADFNNIVHVSARDISTGSETHVVVRSPYGLNNSQVELMRKKLDSWVFERETRSTVDCLVSGIEEILNRGTDALSCDEVTTLRASCELITSLVRQRVPREELRSAVSSARSVFEQAQHKVSRYEVLVNEIEGLIVEVARFTRILWQFDETEADLLSQGEALLREYLQRGLPAEELSKMLFSVRSEYITAKANATTRVLHDSAPEQMRQWAIRLADLPLDASTVADCLAEITSYEETKAITALVQHDALSTLTSIEQKVAHGFGRGSCPWAYFVLVASVSVDLNIITAAKGLSCDEEGRDLLSLAMFNGLSLDRGVDDRRVVAEIMADFLPLHRHFEDIVVYTCREPDNRVREFLFSYLDKHPQSSFEQFFVESGPSFRMEMCKDNRMLARLAKQPGEQVMGIFTRALGDPSPSVRLLALEFVEQSQQISYIPHIHRMVHLEPDSSVRERIVRLLGKLRDPRNVSCILDVLAGGKGVDENLIFSSLEKNIEFVDADIARLYYLSRAIIREKRKLRFRESLFLRRFKKKCPEMADVVEYLRQINKNK